jgi:hypothetical protein
MTEPRAGTAPAAPADVAAALAAWRAQGADRVDPLRFAALEALTRRATAYQGAARACIDERLTARLAAFGQAVAAADAAPPVPAAPPPAAPRGPLGALADRLAQRAAGRAVPPGAGSATDAAAPTLAPAPAGLPDALSEVRATWARLHAERRLQESLARVPANAGPLNSTQLVLRALLLMHEISPAYLQCFMAQVDTLAWLERTGERHHAGRAPD